LRMVYEADLDAHFSELAFALRTRIQDFYPNWRSPEARLIEGMADLKEAAAGLRSVGENMSRLGTEMKAVVSSVETLATDIERNTRETVQKTVELFSVQLAQELPKITHGVNQGLDDGTKKILDHLLRQEDEARVRLAARARDFTDRLDAVGKALESSSANVAALLTEKAAQFAEATRQASARLAEVIGNQMEELAGRHSAAAEAFRAVTATLTESASHSASAAQAVAHQIQVHDEHTQEVAAQFQGLSSAMKAASDDLSGRLAEISTSVDAPRARLEGLLEKLEASYTAAVKKTFDQAGASVHDAAAKLGSASTAASKALEEVARIIAPVSSSLREAAMAAGEVVDTSKAIRDLTKQDRELLRDLRPSLEGIRTAISEQTSALDTATSGLKKAVEITAEEQRAIEEVAARVHAATRNGARQGEREP
jgi:hypothetical protein